MATGDAQDMVTRLRAALPRRWFPDDAPALGVVLRGMGTVWASIYGLLAYVRAQTRLATASGQWLDIAGYDFLGVRMQRRKGEADSNYRVRLMREVFRHRNTRQSVIAAVQDATGLAPVVFEPQRIQDTGAIGVGSTMGYGVAGGWGSYDIPFQFLVTAARPHTAGVAQVAGYGSPNGGFNTAAPIEWASVELIGATVVDQDIRDAILSVLPVGTIAWVGIGASIPTPVVPGVPGGLSA